MQNKFQAEERFVRSSAFSHIKEKGVFMDFDMIKFADFVAEKAHFGQVDKAGVRYVEHPRAVASLLDGEKEKFVHYFTTLWKIQAFPKSR